MQIEYLQITFYLQIKYLQITFYLQIEYLQISFYLQIGYLQITSSIKISIDNFCSRRKWVKTARLPHIAHTCYFFHDAVAIRPQCISPIFIDFNSQYISAVCHQEKRKRNSILIKPSFPGAQRHRLALLRVRVSVKLTSTGQFK